jgi:tetratricopeptide (TPR) repeat protein
MNIRHVASGIGIILALLLAANSGAREDSPEESFASGLAHLEESSWQEAIDAFSKALMERPDWPDALVNRGVARAGLGDFTGAVEDYGAALRLDPEDTDALVNRGVARHELKQYAEALSDYTRALELNENDVDAYRNRALTFRAAGELVAAVEDFGAAIRLDPDDVSLYRGRAAVRREQEDEEAAGVDDALAELTEAIAAAPEDAVPRRQRGLAFFEVGEYALTISDLTEAIRLAPDDADTYVARGHAWFVQGHDDKAIEDYSNALDRGVKAASEAHAGRGNAYETSGNLEKAVADYEEAVRLDPEDEDTRIHLAWILATDPAEDYRDGKRALELATQAVALTDGRHWRALDVMAAACAETGGFADAEKYARQSLELAPADQRDAIQKRLKRYRSSEPYRELGE